MSITASACLICDYCRRPVKIPEWLEAVEHACDVQTVSDRLAKLKELSEMATQEQAKWLESGEQLDWLRFKFASDNLQGACTDYVRELIAGKTP